ncbi:hypothetical protein HXX76_013322 [Chlamydomonas incerta]|uniref:C2 domain-containing protein n=1 Tax=Chlamydomonas incerta TaxID=51695 RepID=A0A835SFC4_CHLIN|nr:hypothetical protein HXX76_013322 [Chlamydomonas incerta]|eukprot:KAG2425949.1 hypothetical protein HXX76_013322 [Chlamydomonas incerta]
MASATKLPVASGVSAAGVLLGVLLTVALQMVGRWLQRQRWARQVMELLDSRRSSGSAASTSGSRLSSRDGTDDDAASWGSWRPPDAAGSSSRASLDRSASGSADGEPGSNLAAFLGGPGVGGAAQGGTVGWGGNWTADSMPSAPPNSPSAAAVAAAAAMGGLPPPPVGADAGESVEWVNMCWRKVWRVYQRGLERWIIDLLQPVFDGLVKDGSVPRWLCRLRVVELTLDHEAPYFSNMRRRNSRKDSDLNGVVDLRYTGGARMLLMLELGEGRWRFKVPVLVSDLDLECKMWLKLRLAPMCPWIGTISLAFVGPPNVKVQLSPYNRVRLMRVPVVQNYLRKLLTVDLPGLMVLPERLEINIPPSVTTIAEAAVGRDTIMRAVASAVLQADAVEAALLAALPLGPQTPAGGITLPEAFKGELSVTLREARNLPVWGFPGQSNPYCRLVLGDQAVQSRREGDTSHPGRHRAPVWNQEFQFLVEDPGLQVLEMLVKDSHLTGRTEVGRASIRLEDLIKAQQSAEGGKVSMWVPLQSPAPSYGITSPENVPTGEVLVELTYKAFDDDVQDSGYREAENFTKQAAAQAPITDIRSAAAASSRAAVAASAAVSAIAMTKAAAARAAARAARAAQEAAVAAAGAAKGAVDQGASMIGGQQQQQGQAAGGKAPIPLPAGREPRALPAASNASAPAPPSASAVDAVVAGATDVEAVAVAAARQRLRVLAEEAAAEAAAAAAAASASSQAAAAVVTAATVSTPTARSAADGAAAARRGRGTPHDDDDGDGGHHDGDGHGPGGGGAAAPVLERVPALAVEARGGRGAGGNGAGVSAAMVAGAASLPTSAAAATTVVLERPPSRVAGASTASMEEELIGSGGGDGDVTGRHSLGLGARPVLGGGGGGGADGGRPSDASAGGTLARPGGVDGLSHVPTTAATGVNGNGMSVLPPRHTGAAALAEADEQEWQSAPLQQLLEDYDVTGQEAGAAASAAHGAADGGSGGTPQAAGAPAGASVSGAHASGGGGGGVMGALASLATVSAHSLSSLARGARPPEAPSSAPGAAADGGSGSSGTAWLEAIVSRLPRYKSHHDEDDGKRKQAASGKDGKDGAARQDKDAAAAAAAAAGLDAAAAAAAAAGEDHPWWQFWAPKGGSAKLGESQQQQPGSSAAATDSDGGPRGANADATFSSTDGGASANTPDGGRPWWQFWPWDDGAKGAKGRAGEGEAAGSGSGGGGGEGGEGPGSKPVEAIYIPPDLPLEEIAAEVQRLKEDSWRERSDHVSSLWMKAVERNDRKWLMLAAFLLSVAVGLLTVVAWRLEQLEQLQVAAPQIALMTMQAALQVLEEQARSSGGL